MCIFSVYICKYYIYFVYICALVISKFDHRLCGIYLSSWNMLIVKFNSDLFTDGFQKFCCVFNFMQKIKLEFTPCWVRFALKPFSSLTMYLNIRRKFRCVQKNLALTWLELLRVFTHLTHYCEELCVVLTTYTVEYKKEGLRHWGRG